MQPNNQVMQPPPVAMAPPNQIPMIPNQVVIAPNQFVMPNGRRYNNNLVMGLGITQLSLGALIMIVSIIATLSIYYYYVTVHLFGISGGIWIMVTGIMGIISSRKPHNGCLGGTYMGFNIVSSFLSFIGMIFYFAWFRYNIIGIIEGILLLFEFGVALTAAIFGCVYQCGANQTRGYITQPPQQFIQYGYPQVTSTVTTQGVPTAHQGVSVSAHGAPMLFNQQQHIPQNQQVYYTQQPPPYTSEQINGQNIVLQAQSVAIPPVTQENK